MGRGGEGGGVFSGGTPKFCKRRRGGGGGRLTFSKISIHQINCNIKMDCLFQATPVLQECLWHSWSSVNWGCSLAGYFAVIWSVNRSTSAGRRHTQRFSLYIDLEQILIQSSHILLTHLTGSYCKMH